MLKAARDIPKPVEEISVTRVRTSKSRHDMAVSVCILTSESVAKSVTILLNIFTPMSAKTRPVHSAHGERGASITNVVVPSKRSQASASDTIRLVDTLHDPSMAARLA